MSVRNIKLQAYITVILNQIFNHLKKFNFLTAKETLNDCKEEEKSRKRRWKKNAVWSFFSFLLEWLGEIFTIHDLLYMGSPEDKNFDFLSIFFINLKKKNQCEHS